MIEKIVRQIIEKLTDKEQSKKNTTVYGVDFNREFDSPETKILKESLSTNLPELVTVEEYYNHVGINLEQSYFLKGIMKQKSMGLLEWTNFSAQLPYYGRATVEEFLKYTIPKKLIDLAEEKIKKAKYQALIHFTENYNNPMLDNTLTSRAIRTIETLHDALIYTITFGKTIILRETDEDIKKREIVNQYEHIRNVEIPVFTELILTHYFKFEKELPLNILKNKNSR